MEYWCTCNLGLRVISKVISLLSLVGDALCVGGGRRPWSAWDLVTNFSPEGPCSPVGKKHAPSHWWLVFNCQNQLLLSSVTCGVTSSELGFPRLDCFKCGFMAGGRPQTTVKCKVEIADTNHFSLGLEKKKKQKFNPRVTKWHHFDLCQFTVLSRDPQQKAH